ncbi:MAG: hypothetical protein IMW89_21525 [Ktedonobacteraceae bacterium]|nr:hypothetical protein [Ktedonobacteraceae bacterium]
MTKQPKRITWQSSLNKRQQDYLLAVYEIDQQRAATINDAAARGRWASVPASQWRWMPYNAAGAALLRKVIELGYRDPGTGSTFAALERRGLLITRYEPGSLGAPILFVQITKAGRKLVREALGESAPKTLPAGTLRAWHWRALVHAYQAGEQGVTAWPRGIGEQTVRRLLEYRIEGKAAPLIERAKMRVEPFLRRRWPGDHGEVTDVREALRITPFGAAFYARAFPRYRELYPDVPAPEPVEPCDPLAPFVEAWQDIRTCRACRGEYPVAVTRCFQLNQRWTWSVSEEVRRSDERMAGDSPSPSSPSARKSEPCLCREEDIQEVTLPFLALLDRLIAQGWQVSFPYHPWITYLDSLVGGLSIDRKLRWYEATLVKEKVLPLLDDTALDDARNVVKGNMRSCSNERRGCGSIYPQGLSRGLSLQPVALTKARNYRSL